MKNFFLFLVFSLGFLLLVTPTISAALLFSDGFESGTLVQNGWVLRSAAGVSNWTNITTNPFNGARHAQARPLSATIPSSTMERTFSTVGYSGVNLSYYRRLVALDAPDEFNVTWYNGSRWITIESTGASSVNNAAYVNINFSLGSTASNRPNITIRFECTANLVSEFCRLDDVNLTGDLDLTPPSVYLLEPANATIRSSPLFFFSANISDNLGLSNATLFVWNSTGLVGLNTTSLTGSSALVNLSLTMPRDDSYSWNYLAYDAAGNAAFNSSNYTLIYDATTPSLSFAAPTELNGSFLSRSSLLVNLTASDLFLNQITVRLYDASYALLKSNSSLTGSLFINYSGLVDGSYYFNATANDSAGNVNYSETRTVVLDRARPLVSILTPQNTTYTTVQTRLNFSASDTYLQSCWYSVDSGITNFTVICGTNVTGLNSDQGSSTWVVYANDSAGNVNSSSVTFFVDSLAPVFSNVSQSPTSPTAYSLFGNYTFSVLWADNSGLSSTLFEFDNVSYPMSFVNGVYTITLHDLSAGNHTYRYLANDSLGNSNQTSLETYVITQATPDLRFLLNSDEGDLFITYGDFVNATVYSSTSPIRLDRAGVDVTAENGASVILGAGNYTYTSYALENQNYTALTTSFIVAISQAIPLLNLSLSPGDDVMYPVLGSASGLGCPLEISCTLYRDGVLVSNPDVVILSAGTHLYVYNVSESSNYSAASSSQSLVVHQAPGAVYTSLNNSRSNITLTTGQSIYLNATLVNGSDLIQLLLDDVLINQGISPLGNLTLFSHIGTFKVSASYLGNENYTSSYEEWYVVANSDGIPPTFNSFTESPFNNSSYTEGARYEFNATIADGFALDSTGITFDGINYSVANISNVFSFSLNDLAAGTYPYYWWANDSDGNYNVSTIRSYTVGLATGSVSLFLNGVADNVSVSYPELVSASATTDYGALGLFLNGVDIASYNHLNLSLAAGTYEVLAESSGDENHSASTVSYTIDVARASSSISLSLNESRSNITLERGSIILVNASRLRGEGALSVFVNGTLVHNASQDFYDVVNFTQVGTIEIRAHYEQTQNYSSSDESWYATVVYPALLEISCTIGGPYQPYAEILVKGNVRYQGLPLSSQPVNLSLSNASDILASINAISGGDGLFEESFDNISAGIYTFSAFSSYLDQNVTCSDGLRVGGPASLVLDKSASVYNLTNDTITYAISLRLINTGGADALSANISEANSSLSPYFIGTLGAGAFVDATYFLSLMRLSSDGLVTLPSADAAALDAYSGSVLFANSTSLTLSIPAVDVGPYVVLSKNIVYVSEANTSITYNVSTTLFNAGNQDLSNLTYADDDISSDLFSLDLNRTTFVTYSSLVVLPRSANTTRHIFALARVLFNEFTFYGNQPEVNVPGYGGPADVLVHAPFSVPLSSSFDSTFEIRNMNPDIGQDFQLNYWISTANEEANVTSGQRTLYVPAQGITNSTVTFAAPLAVGAYRLHALARWMGGAASAFTSFDVVSNSDSGSTGGGGGGGSSGGGNSSPNRTAPTGAVIGSSSEPVSTLTCSLPSIPDGLGCCLDENTNGVCDLDEPASSVSSSRALTGLFTLDVVQSLAQLNLWIAPLLFLISLSLLLWIFLRRHHLGAGNSTRVSHLIGRRVYTSEGTHVGIIRDVFLKDYSINSLKIELARKHHTSHHGIIIPYRSVSALKEVVLVDSAVLSRTS